MITLTSTSRVCKNSSDKLPSWVISKEFKIALALQIWCSQTPLKLLDSGGFLFYIIHSPPFSFKRMNHSLLIWSISWNAWVSSPDAPTTFEPLSDLILKVPLCPTIFSSSWWMNQWSYNLNMYDHAWHTSIQSTISTVFLLTILHEKWTKQVHPQYVNGGSSLILSLGKSAILCWWSLPLNCLHLTHFKMLHLSKELHLANQKPEDIIWFIVTPQPAWASDTMTPVYYQLSNSAGFWQQHWVLHLIC